MSADNGIYVLKTIRNRRNEGTAWVQSEPHFVYRVAHTSAIENFEWYKENKPYNLGAYMVEVWGKSKVYTDSNQAIAEALKLAESIENLEYGVSVIDATDMIFYGDM
jgi:hypothetical protein